MAITIRTATAADAAVIGEMIGEFQVYLRSLGDRTDFAFNAAAYVRDGFGAHPAFAGCVAELDGLVAGYLLYHHGYDTDRGERSTYVIDLYVREPFRQHGVGSALMQSVADACAQSGGRALVWTVFKNNRRAFDFYEHLGAQRVTDLELMFLPVPRP